MSNNIASEILRRFSASMVRVGSSQECLGQLAGLLRRHAGVDTVAITLRDPETGESVVVREGDSGRATAAGFVFQRELRGGIEDYGVLQVTASKPAIRAVELFKLLTAIEKLVIHYGQLEAQRQSQRRLTAGLNVLERQLHQIKLEARAVGLLAASHGVGYDEARGWLEQADEAERLRWLEDMEKTHLRGRRQVAA